MRLQRIGKSFKVKLIQPAKSGAEKESQLTPLTPKPKPQATSLCCPGNWAEKAPYSPSGRGRFGHSSRRHTSLAHVTVAHGPAISQVLLWFLQRVVRPDQEVETYLQVRS